VWKKIKGSVQPDLLVHSLDVTVCSRVSDVVREGDGDMISVAMMLWRAMMSLPHSSTSGNSVERFAFLDAHLSACADVLVEGAIGK
jgi:hypothetical protein